MDISILIVDDHQLSALSLMATLSSNGFEVVRIANSFEQGERLALKHKPDIMLVDVKIEGRDDGIALVKHLNQTLNRRIPTIFLTANHDTVTRRRAFGANPAGFLTKPFKEKDLMITLELAFHNAMNEKVVARSEGSIYIKSHSEYARIFKDDILYVKANGSYCQVVTRAKEYLLTLNLNNCLQRLSDEKFIRVHRSYIVNRDHISGYDNSNVIIDEDIIPIGRTYKKQLLMEVKSLG